MMCPYFPGIAIALAGAKAYMQKSLRRVLTTICGALFEPDALLQDSACAIVMGFVKSPSWTMSLSYVPSKICMLVAGAVQIAKKVSFAALLRSSSTTSLIVQSLGSTDSTIHRLGTYTDMQGGLFMSGLCWWRLHVSHHMQKRPRLICSSKVRLEKAEDQADEQQSASVTFEPRPGMSTDCSRLVMLSMAIWCMSQNVIMMAHGWSLL